MAEADPRVGPGRERRAGPPLPGEHGAWATLVACLALGGALALQSGGSLLLALGAGLAAIDLFMLREALCQGFRPIRARNPRQRAAAAAAAAHARRWAGGELLLLVVLGLALILATGQWWLAGVGVAALGFLALFVALRHSRKEHTFGAEVVGFTGVAAACPVTYLLAASVQGDLAQLPGAPWPGGLLVEAALLWVLLAAYFVGPVFYVRMKVAQQRERPQGLGERLRLGLGTGSYALLVAALLAWAGGPLGLGPWPLLAYLPALAKNLVGIVRVRLPLNLIRIGLTEVGLAFLYAVGLYLGLAA